MEVYGQLQVAGGEQLTADPTGLNLFPGRIWFRTDLNVFRSYDGANIKEFADLSSAQQFTNKILSGPQFSNYGEFVQQAGAIPTPAAGRNRIYFKTDGVAYTLDENGNELPLGSGSGGAKNYFQDSDATIDSTIGNWLTDDGVGGASAGLSLAVTAVSGELLAGANSLKVTKDAADRNGHFVKVLSKTIDPADRGVPNYGSFAFRPLAGYESGDLVFEVYDVTNATVLFSGTDLDILNQSSRFNWAANLESTTEQVEFRMKVANANTNAFDAVFDEFTFGPTVVGVGYNSHPLTDMLAEANASLLPTGLGVTPGSYTKYAYARFGDHIRLSFSYIHSATPGTGGSSVEFPFPFGLTFKGDGTQVSTAATTFNVDHNVSTDTGADQYMATGMTIDTSRMRLIRMGTGSIISGQFIEAGAQILVDIMIPVNEWETSGALGSNQLGLQTVKAVATGGTQSIPTAVFTKVDLSASARDTHGSIDLANNRIIIPVSGDYDLNFYGIFAGDTTGVRQLTYNINGVSQTVRRYNPIASDMGVDYNIDNIALSKGDYVEMFVNHTAGANLNFSSPRFSLQRTSDLTVLGAIQSQEVREIQDVGLNQQTSPGTGVWYQTSAAVLTLPEGEWDIAFDGTIQAQMSVGSGTSYAALGTSATPGVDLLEQVIPGGVTTAGEMHGFSKLYRKVILTEATNFYPNVRVSALAGGSTLGSLLMRNNIGAPGVISARRIK